jgi:hypothetical protein
MNSLNYYFEKKKNHVKKFTIYKIKRFYNVPIYILVHKYFLKYKIRRYLLTTTWL